MCPTVWVMRGRFLRLQFGPDTTKQGENKVVGVHVQEFNIAFELPRPKQGERGGETNLLDSIHGEGLAAGKYVKKKGRRWFSSSTEGFRSAINRTEMLSV